MSLKLSDLPVPQYRYFPTHLMESKGPKQWARLRLLQACERLDIPQKLWPKIPFPELPRPSSHRYFSTPILHVPSFFPLYESEAEWKARLQNIVDMFVSQETSRFRERLQREIENDLLTPIKRTRDTTPIDLRYEWAAKRICYRLRFSEIAKDSPEGYTEQRIKEAVNSIIREAGLRQAK